MIRRADGLILHWMTSNMNHDDESGASSGITGLPPALLHRLGSTSGDAKLAKRFVREKLCKKVQFLQTGNDELMNKVCKQARKFMKYDSDTFANVWSTTVLPAIKNEMNVLRSGYAAAMKNRIIRGKWKTSIGCLHALP